MSAAIAPSAERPSAFSRGRELILPAGLVLAVLVILVPLPAALMDLLLAANITVAVILLLTTVQVRTPLELSIFPTLLLATTLSRVVLNVATTRLILSRAGTEGLEAAGGVIRSFGQFVAGDHVLIGLVVFLIILVVQFVIITKGATRISEVAARFMLDGLPGRQMAIDSDLNAGLIDAQQAQRRRQELLQQADFYGAMDGASKFIRGDAIAGLIITMTNILGGLVLGVMQYNMSLAQASALFTKLTIGDGLVSQVPALLISLAAGLLVTRSGAETNLPREFITQLFSRPQALAVAAAFVAALVFTQLPAAPLLLIATSCGGLAVLLSRREEQAAAAADATAAQTASAATARRSDDRLEDHLRIDPIVVEIGFGLIRLADPQRGGDLLERVGRVRQRVAGELGIVMPKVRIRDNVRLESHRYQILLSGAAVAQGEVHPGLLLAVAGPAAQPLEGLPCEHPLHKVPAVWVEPARRELARQAGYTIEEPARLLADHLSSVVGRHAEELLTRDATRHLLDELRKTAPTAVEEVVPGTLRLAEVQHVLRLLLREGVPLKPLDLILEAIGDAAARNRHPVWLAEAARRRLARTLTNRAQAEDGVVHAVALSPRWESRLAAAQQLDAEGLHVALPASEADQFGRQVEAALSAAAHGIPTLVLLTDPAIRPAVRQLTWLHFPELVVLSTAEIVPGAPLHIWATVDEPA